MICMHSTYPLRDPSRGNHTWSFTAAEGAKPVSLASLPPLEALEQLHTDARVAVGPTVVAVLRCQVRSGTIGGVSSGMSLPGQGHAVTGCEPV